MAHGVKEICLLPFQFSVSKNMFEKTDLDVTSSSMFSSLPWLLFCLLTTELTGEKKKDRKQTSVCLPIP